MVKENDKDIQRIANMAEAIKILNSKDINCFLDDNGKLFIELTDDMGFIIASTEDDKGAMCRGPITGQEDRRQFLGQLIMNISDSLSKDYCKSLDNYLQSKQLEMTFKQMHTLETGSSN